jgi:hypothetical protein
MHGIGFYLIVALGEIERVLFYTSLFKRSLFFKRSESFEFIDDKSF